MTKTIRRVTLDEARERIGAAVIYRSHPTAEPEDGYVSSVSDRFVFVLYEGDRQPKATRADDLEWFPEGFQWFSDQAATR